ncbi:hypothetical protein MPER_07966, partial [Moniliophthora perniciosa FA553]
KAFDTGSHDDAVSNGEVIDSEGSDDEGSDDEWSDDEGSDDEGTDNGAREPEVWNPTREKEELTRLEGMIEEFEEIDAELLEDMVFRTSFDLTELDQVNDPAELMKEVRAFEKLRDELVKGEKQRKIESARRIDDEHFAKLSSNHTPSTSGASPSPTPLPTPVVPPSAPARLRARGAKLLKKVGRTMRRIVKLFCR